MHSVYKALKHAVQYWCSSILFYVPTPCKYISSSATSGWYVLIIPFLFWHTAQSDSHPAASCTLSPFWPPSRLRPCRLSAPTPPAAVCGSSNVLPERPSPFPSVCFLLVAAAMFSLSHQLQRTAPAIQPNDGKNPIKLSSGYWRKATNYSHCC